MTSYDSLLFGYGLSLSIFSEIMDDELINYPNKHLLDFGKFIPEFLAFETDRKLNRAFRKLFPRAQKYDVIHDRTRQSTLNRLNEIQQNGFEAWVGEHLFGERKPTNEETLYLYTLYNYWAHWIQKSILCHPRSRHHLKQRTEALKELIKHPESIYTTNFDVFLDEFMPLQHLHGRFVVPIESIEEIILAEFPALEQFEYTYLFGTNGLEKLTRLNRIRKLKQYHYDLDFFYRKDLFLGHLLIYGLSFSNSGILSTEFTEIYPKHRENYFINYCDGHILLKLCQMLDDGLLTSLTVSYHSDSDFHRINRIFSSSILRDIVYIKHTSEILNI